MNIKTSFKNNKHRRFQRKQLILMMAASLGLTQAAQAQFSNPLQLSDINGANGFVIHGETEDDQYGYSVSSAGDINGDVIDDLLIGAHRVDPNGNSYVGSSQMEWTISPAGDSCIFPSTI
ncbi:hypothetical protein MNBD_GAMMA02-1590 [hydrothermal vent metagenome]|uniref:Uncharacterized protein n=1 Tax=hydrothermal vent metagenome TaxID=652676 RepID=A0A3B0W9N2_9ZZZZ